MASDADRMDILNRKRESDYLARKDFEKIRKYYPELRYDDVFIVTPVSVRMNNGLVYKVPEQEPVGITPVSIDILKGLSQKEIEAYKIILDHKIIPLRELEEINLSYGGAVGRLKQKGLVEVLPLEKDHKIKCVVLTGIVD